MKINFNGKQKFLKILTLTLFSFLLLQTSWGQIVKSTNNEKSTVTKNSILCNHDHAQELQYEKNPELQEIMMQAEKQLQNAIKIKKSQARSNELYVIPIVFHVLHRGSQEGFGDNISNDRIYDALAHLNADFANTSGSGTDVGIQFCLAQQDPDGNSVYNSDGDNITGIQRADASGINQFQVYGIWSGVNEVAAKALSNWPEEDYVNVWIAHRLYTGSGDAAGFAYFPPAGDDIDGIALRTDATGLAANSKVITHEAGHFFWLFHTFQGGDDVNCPANGNCTTDGDRICETRIHNTFPNFPYPCDENQYENCDMSYNLGYNVTENHMNYTNNSCRDEFVPEQADRMRATLETSRSGLLNSIGCSPGCPGLVSSFTLSPNNTTVPIGTPVTFTSTSTGATTFSWTIDGVIEGTASILDFTFTVGGVYNVCLDVTDGEGCTSRSCQVITATPVCIPPEDPCEQVINGDFEQIGAAGNTNDFDAVCGWEAIQATPFFCDNPGNNAIGLYLYSTDFTERITSTDPLDFEVGDQCRISFDYLITRNSPQAIQIALVDNNMPTGNNAGTLPANATIIAEVLDPPSDYFSQQNHVCYDDNFSFHHFEADFIFTDVDNVFLTITGLPPVGNNNITFIDNVSINCCGTTGCTPLPDFTWEGCFPTVFTGTNAGDGDDYFWTFLCDGSTQSGPIATFDIPANTPCEVCLTISCDEETSATVCQVVETDCIDEPCLEVEIKDLYCKDQGTEDPDDDYWYFSMQVNDLSGNGIFWVATGEINDAGSYGECKTIWPSGGTISANPTYSFTVCDAFDPHCCVDVVVEAPEPCSIPCDIDVKLETKCDQTDYGNFYYVIAEVQVADPTTCFMMKRKNPDGSEEIIDTYYGTQVIEYGPLSPLEEFTLWFVLCDAPDYCIVDFSVKAPDKCENCLDYIISDITCYNNGTTSPDDDYWSFDIYVEGPNDFWIADDPVNQSGSYGNVKTIFVSSFDDLSFLLYDNKKKCKRKVIIEAPKTCSYDCDFEFEYKVSDCKYIEGKYVFYVVIHITSSAYECFTIKKKNSDDTEEILGNYPPGTDIVLGPFAAGEDFTIWVMACEVFDCVLDTWIDAPDCGESEERGIATRDINIDFDVNIHPNPVQNQLTISSTTNINSLAIYNSTGELVENQKIDNREFVKDLSQYKSGIYFLRLNDENGETTIKKFIKID